MSNHLRSIQDQILLFCQAHDILASPEHRFIDLQSELGEAGKEILKATEYGKEPFEKTDAFEEELGDALFSFLCLANSSGVDLQSSLEKVLQKYERRLRRGGAGSDREQGES